MKTTKTETKPKKGSLNKKAPKFELKSAYGKYKGAIVEEEDCWDEDLERTISAV